ncbi:hypothetical protein [Clostridium paraputrificum]|uniref:hypothetical protein n=1 Tax=Clostridium paraputrificum TaxID=29363 RepID=UPI0034A1F250
MSKKVKRGSALITVLVFSLFFVVISGVAVMAVVNTVNGNSREEKYQTLYYEAEAGIEKAIAYANRGDYNSLVVGDSKDWTLDSNYIFNLNGDIVKFSVEKKENLVSTDEYLEVISTSESSSGMSRRIKTKLEKNLPFSDVFKYSLCAAGITVTSGGTIDGDASSINSGKASASIGAVGDSDRPVEHNKTFDLPQFRTELIKNYPVIDMNFSALSNSTFNTVVTEINNAEIDSIKPIVKAEIEPVATKYPITLYMINAGEVNINISSDSTLNNVIILCSGNININMGVSTIHLVNCSIIGNNITVERGNLTMSYAPYDDGDFPLMSGNGSLDDSKVEKMFNEVITHYAPNYVYGGNGGSGGTITYTPVDYE